MTTTHLLVGNPTAQSGKNAERIDQAVRGLAATGVSCDVLATLPDGATIPALADRLRGSSTTCVIAMGGDGTFREVASGLLESGRAEHVSMAMLPTGTANDQGRSFGLDAGEAALTKNLEVVVAGRETRLDAGKMMTPGHTAWFFDSAGWGISARVLRARNEDRALVDTHPLLKVVYRDHMVYAGALLRVFLESYVVDDAFTAEIEAEGADGGRIVLEGLTDLIVKGTRVYGGAWVFDRTSRHDDGLFEIVPFRGKLDWTSKAIVDLDGNPVTEELLNAVGVEHSHPFRFSRATIHLKWPTGGAAPAAQIDGEEYPVSDHVTLEVVPRAIRLVVP